MGNAKICLFSKPQVKDFIFCFKLLSWHLGWCSIWPRAVTMGKKGDWLRTPVPEEKMVQDGGYWAVWPAWYTHFHWQEEGSSQAAVWQVCLTGEGGISSEGLCCGEWCLHIWWLCYILCGGSCMSSQTNTAQHGCKLWKIWFFIWRIRRIRIWLEQLSVKLSIMERQVE